MFGQYTHLLQTMDEMEVRRLFSGMSGTRNNVRPELSSGLNTPTPRQNTQSSQSTSSSSYSQHQQHPMSIPFMTRFHHQLGSENQRTTSSTSSSSSREVHNSRRQEAQQISAPARIHHVQTQAQQYNNPSRTPTIITPISGFTSNQQLAFIPQQHLFSPQAPHAHEVVPYNLTNKPVMQQLEQQQPPQNPQIHQLVGRGEGDTMQNNYSRNAFVVNGEKLNPNPAFFQQQEHTSTTSEENEADMAYEEEENEGGDDGENVDDDDEYECEEEEEDEEIVESVATPVGFTCKFCPKTYKRKANYLAHLSNAHNSHSQSPPRSTSLLIPTPHKPTISSSPSRRSSNQSQSHGQDHNSHGKEATFTLLVPFSPEPDPQIKENLRAIETMDIETYKVNDVYKCFKCPKKFKTDRNFRRHLIMHMQPIQQGQLQQPRQQPICSTNNVVAHRAVPDPLPVPTQPPLFQLFKCPHCPEFLEDKDKLRTHEIDIHRSCICSDCGELVAAASFVEHKKRHLTETYKWKCKICRPTATSTFEVYKEFREHMLKSHAPEPYNEPCPDFLTRPRVKAAEVVPSSASSSSEEVKIISEKIISGGNGNITKNTLALPTSAPAAQFQRRPLLIPHDQGKVVFNNNNSPVKNPVNTPTTSIFVQMKPKPAVNVQVKKQSTVSLHRRTPPKRKPSTRPKRAAAARKRRRFSSSSSSVSEVDVFTVDDDLSESKNSDSDPTFILESDNIENPPFSTRTRRGGRRMPTVTVIDPPQVAVDSEMSGVINTKATEPEEMTIDDEGESMIEVITITESTEEIGSCYEDSQLTTNESMDELTTEAEPMNIVVTPGNELYSENIQVCILCNISFENNRQLTDHILIDHCSQHQPQIKLFRFENDPELLEFIEIVEEEDY